MEEYLTGYCEIDEKFTTNENTQFNSNILINDGKFAKDVYVYAYDGTNWYLAKNTKFINGGVFADIHDGENDCFWTYYVADGLEISNEMKSKDNLYTVGYKVILDANYEGGYTKNIYTLSDGLMTELYNFDRERYKFVEWNTQKNGKGETINKDSKITNNITLYAQWEIIEGKASVNNSNENININKEIIESILNEEDKEKMRNGYDISVECVMENINDTINNEDKEKVEEVATKYNGKVGAYIDISLLKKIEGESSDYITQTNENVKVAIKIPEELINNETNKIKRNYKILRLHDGEVDVLDCTYNEENKTLEFETNKFSVYCIMYSDTNINNNEIKNPKTGDNIVYTVIIFAVSTISLYTINKKSISQKRH